MNTEPADNLQPFSDWLAWSLRFTVFPSSGSEFDPSTWWLELTEKPPDTRTEKLAQNLTRDEGPFESGKLSFARLPGRLDLVLHPAEDVLIEQQGIYGVGPADAAVSVFVRLAHKMLRFDSFPSVDRLAFAPVFMLPAQSKVDGYSTLSRYLPHVQIDSEKSSDFLYQINRRRSSQALIEPLEINRLAKWSVYVQRMAVFPGGFGEKPVKSQEREPDYACRVEMDINTFPQFEATFTQDMCATVLDELVEMAKEFCVKGDID